jgi:hypothetical protein
MSTTSLSADPAKLRGLAKNIASQMKFFTCMTFHLYGFFTCMAFLPVWLLSVH